MGIHGEAVEDESRESHYFYLGAVIQGEDRWLTPWPTAVFYYTIDICHHLTLITFGDSVSVINY